MIRLLQIAASFVIVAGLTTATLLQPAPANAGRPRVALQAGHWRANEAPLPLRLHTGGSIAGVDEAAITLDIAARTAAHLRAAGIDVEILPTWFPDDYAADAFVSIHVNGAPGPVHRGFFADRAADSLIPAAEDRLVRLINSAYGEATDLPYVYRPTRDTRYYYGYYRVTGATPAALVELGFLTNEDDRAFLVNAPDRAAAGLARAIQVFLDQPAPDGGPRPEEQRTGNLHTDGVGGAFLRLRPTRQSSALALVPDGAPVSILGTEAGETVEAGNNAWYQVRFQDISGYIYTGLVE